MSTEELYLAMCQSTNRYQVCQLAAKGVHAVHKRGERMQDSINQVMELLRGGNPETGRTGPATELIEAPTVDLPAN